MSKLEELMAELCPDGVEFVSMNGLLKRKQISTITPTIKVKRNDYLDIGETPIISQEIEYISGYCNVHDKNIPYGNYVCFGDHSEHIKYINFSFVQGADGLKIMRTNESTISSRYLFHALSSKYQRHNNYERHFKYLTDTIIPVPPLPVQREIVRILDNFTELTAKLTESLSKELTKRKQQYQYYRDKLLTFAAQGEGYASIELGSIGKISMCKRIMKAETSSDGDVPFYKIGTFGKKPDAYISREKFEEYRKAYPFPKRGDVLISAAGTIGRTVIYDGEDAYYQDSNIVWIDNDESVVLNRYLFYCYQLQPWAVSEGGTIARLYNDNISRTKIRVPSMEKQKRIIAILDCFDALCTNLSSGLTSEIEARQKQYEYYRNKLLSFREMSVNEQA